MTKEELFDNHYQEYPVEEDKVDESVVGIANDAFSWGELEVLLAVGDKQWTEELHTVSTIPMEFEDKPSPVEFLSVLCDNDLVKRIATDWDVRFDLTEAGAAIYKEYTDWVEA